MVYEVIIENHSPAKSVTITSLVDNYHGDLTTLGLDCGDTPVTNPLSLSLAADGSSIECTFTGTVPETTEALPTDVTYYPDTVTASGTADDGKAVSAIATAEVQFIPGGSGVAPSPLIEVSKIARPDRVPTGGAVAFTAEVINASATEAVLIEELVDDIHGNLSGRPVVRSRNRSRRNHRYVHRAGQRGRGKYRAGDCLWRVSGETVLGFDDRLCDTPKGSENSTDPAVVTFTINIINNNDFSVDINAISDSVFGFNGSGPCDAIESDAPFKRRFIHDRLRRNRPPRRGATITLSAPVIRPGLPSLAPCPAPRCLCRSCPMATAGVLRCSGWGAAQANRQTKRQ